MPNSSLTPTVDRLRSKVQVLLERYHALEAARQRAEARVARLTEELRKLQEKTDNQARELEYLRVVSVLSPDRSQVQATRTLLADLVRDIDRCIGELSQ